jgi:hypothetical protein
VPATCRFAFTEIVGMDVAIRVLEQAESRLKVDRLAPKQRQRIRLLHGSLMYRDVRLRGFDAAAVMEVIEHLDRPRLRAFERVLFDLEVMSRFAANPKWLIYLPPTMSPSETSKAEGLLEHPAEALAYYRSNRVPSVVVERKHMGSRAILIACKSQDVARDRFGILEHEDGTCYTRTGRRFFEDMSLERELLTCGTWTGSPASSIRTTRC